LSLGYQLFHLRIDLPDDLDIDQTGVTGFLGFQVEITLSDSLAVDDTITDDKC
jgi:hypothetical protein